MNTRVRQYVAAIHPPRAASSFWLALGMLKGQEQSVEPQPCFLMIAYLVAFQLLYGGIYLINDLVDYRSDKRHRLKCRRMIASGGVSRRAALIYALVLISVFVVIALCLSMTLFYYGMFFLMYNLLYSLFLKTIPFVSPVAGGVTHAARYVMGVDLFGSMTEYHGAIAILALATALWYLRRLSEFENQDETRHVLRYYSSTKLRIITFAIGGVFPVLAFFSEDSHSLILGCALGYAGMLVGYFRIPSVRPMFEKVIFR